MELQTSSHGKVGGAKGGMKVAMLTSEPQEEADRAKEDWGAGGDDDIKFIGEPSIRLALYLRSRGEFLPDLEIVGPGSPDTGNLYGGFSAFNRNHHKLSSLEWYPHGCLQPGCLIVSPAVEGKEDPIVLFRWVLASSISNIGGAGGRPLWKQIMVALNGQLDKLERGEEVVPNKSIDASWSSTVRDLVTCIFTSPITMAKYALGNRKTGK